ncbi:MAG: hypothetical protein HND47_14835 [Chloroflexi bacterium]|nr:hypothetical protein [Chloroflexota bacterium]
MKVESERERLGAKERFDGWRQAWAESEAEAVRWNRRDNFAVKFVLKVNL